MDNNLSCIRLFADKVQIDNCRETLQANEIAFKALNGTLALAGNEVRLKNAVPPGRRKRTLPLRIIEVANICNTQIEMENKARQMQKRHKNDSLLLI